MSITVKNCIPIREGHFNNYINAIMIKRIFNFSFYIVLIIFIPLHCFADGTYSVGENEDGIFFDTNYDGSWYIDRSDLKHFKIGQKGTYTLWEDRNGIFLFTDNDQKIYIDMEAMEKQKVEMEKVNQASERFWEKLREQRAKELAEWRAKIEREAAEAASQEAEIAKRAAEESRRDEYYPTQDDGYSERFSGRPFFVPAGPSGFINTKTRKYYPSAGPGEVVNTRIGDPVWIGQ